MRVRLPLAALALVLAFAGGLASSPVRDAHAQAAPFAATIYVPSDGLAFRTFEGKVVARLSYDAKGGVFELYDEHEQPAMRVRGDPVARATAAPTPAVKRSEDYGF